MNPVLLKPQSDVGAQVIVQGKVFGEARARDYQALKGRLMDAVLDSWAKVGEGADLVIVEGAGSPAEINLRSRDIANMGFATRADVPVVLVGDIDRGGVIASVAGTHLILPEEDRRMKKFFLVAAAMLATALFGTPSASYAAMLEANIDVSSQTMTVRYGSEVYRWVVSTARPGYFTPRGTYRPQRTARMTK